MTVQLGFWNFKTEKIGLRGYKNEQRENITVGINHNTGDVSYTVYNYR